MLSSQNQPLSLLIVHCKVSWFCRLSSGEDYITTYQLVREIRRIKHAIDTSSSSHRWSFRHLSFGCMSSSVSHTHTEDRLLKGVLDENSSLNGVNGSPPLLEHNGEEEESDQNNAEGIFFLNVIFKKNSFIKFVL